MCCQCKTQNGVDPNRTREDRNIGDKDQQDPREPEHWKQVVESARMFETMQEALEVQTCGLQIGPSL